jgi:hypothetical protein
MDINGTDGYLLEVDVKNPKNYMMLTTSCHSYVKKAVHPTQANPS